MPRDDAALLQAMEQSAAILAAAGFPKMPARVLMTLLAAEEGMTALELADRLGASPAAISGAVRYLQTVHMVHRVAQAGSRRDRYELPEDAWYASMTKNSPLYSTLAGLGYRAVAAIDDPDSDASRRLDEMARFYQFLSARMPALMYEWESVRDTPEE